MSEPIQVYPDPDGGGRTQSTVPVDSTTAVAGTASGAVATGSLLVGSGNTVVAFLQMAYQGGVQPDGRTGVTAIPMPYVTVAIVFGALSVLLWGIALVRGFRMKQKAMELSYAICDLGKKNGLFDKYFKSDKVA